VTSDEQRQLIAFGSASVSREYGCEFFQVAANISSSPARLRYHYGAVPASGRVEAQRRRRGEGKMAYCLLQSSHPIQTSRQIQL
jgi:hypothetical protein